MTYKSLLAFLFIALSGSVAMADTAQVTGSAFYRERIALPPSAIVEVTLEDVSLADAASKTIAATTLKGQSGPPYAFTLEYDSAVIEPTARYSVRATIRNEGVLWFTTDTMVPVITNGAPSEVDLLLVRVAQETAQPASEPFQGMFTYLADAGVFEMCQTGALVPVAQEGAYLDLERSYLNDRAEPGAPVFTTLEGTIEKRPGMEGGEEDTLVISRFISTWPDLTCEQNAASADLVNTIWDIARIKGEALPKNDRRRGAEMILRIGGRYSATAGCNQVNGAYQVDGDAISFTTGPSTLMACPPPLDELERNLLSGLTSAARWKIVGQTLELYDDTGAALAQFVAKPL